MSDTSTQPVANVQWLHRDELKGNDYNPNSVAPPEMKLLKLSIMEDGWTQPIVARSNGEIVDGFHRWTVSADPEVYAMTDGMVPVVKLRDEIDPAHQRMSTIRHNRARGSHAVTSMADIVAELSDGGLTRKEIGTRLGMEPEEVDRLLDRGRMTTRAANPEQRFNPAWIPDW